jgi:metallophosphoesterase superfamily enzyme
MVSRRCFLMSDEKLILPAFGALAGGLDVRDSAYAPLFIDGERHALVPTTARLLRFAVEPASAGARSK